MIKRILTKERVFWLLLGFFAIASILRFFERTITEYNTTLFAMSYKYGFISRGMIGSIWSVIDLITPWDVMSYEHIYIFTMIMTAVLFIVIFIMYKAIIDKCTDDIRENVKYLIIFLSIFLFPMFLTEEVFGRLDLYLYILTFIGVILMIRQKAEWLIVPIVGVCMCIHQGYILTCANILVVMLIYRCITSPKNERGKYICILTIAIVEVASLFVYFEFFSHISDELVYEEVVSNAKALSEDGESFNKSIVNHEILGKDVYNDEWEEREVNRYEFPFFIVCFIPYILIAFSYFKNLYIKMRRVVSKEDNTDIIKTYKAHNIGRLMYMLGGLSVVPQMILKVDYGRYVFMTFSYYILMSILLIIEGDDIISDQLCETKALIKKYTPFPIAILIYPLLYMPLHDVVISGASYRVASWFDFLR